MANAKLGPWVVDTFDEVEWRIYGAGDRDTRRLIGKFDSRLDARAIVAAHNRELAELEARVEQLEDALRDVLDVVSGWCGPMSEEERLPAIKEFVSEALSGPKKEGDG